MSFKGFFRYSESFHPYCQSKSGEVVIQYKNGFLTFKEESLFRDDISTFLMFHSLDGSFPYQNIIDLPGKNYPSSLITQITSLDHFHNIIKRKDYPLSCAILYNEKNNELQIARSSFGLVPLFFIHIPNQFIAFSSILNDLLEMEVVRPYVTIDPNTVWDYLSIKEDASIYRSKTFYRNINSAIPGQLCIFSANQVKRKVYMGYNPDKWKHLNYVDEFAEEFKFLFTKSVKRSINNKNIIGSQLSGGLDSSSVSCTARRIKPDAPIHVFYSDTDSPFASEKHFSLDVSQKIDAIHHAIKPNHNDIENLVLHTSLYGQPEQMALSPTFQGGLISNAFETNCDVLLTGHDGDGIVGKGTTFLSDLAKREDWSRLKLELANFVKNNKFYSLNENWESLSFKAKEQLINEYFFNRRLNSNIKNLNLGKYFHDINIAHRYFNIPRPTLINSSIQTVLNKLKRTFTSTPGSIQKSSNRPNIFKELRDEFLDDSISPQNSEYTNDILFTQTIGISEEYYALSQHYKLSINHPFYDTNLYELCLAVPDAVKFGNGIGRSHLRKAMEGILPDSVRLRSDKAIFNTYAKEAALRLYDQGRDFLSDSSLVWDYVNKNNFFMAVKLLQNKDCDFNTQHLMTFFVNRTIFLAVWLYSVRQKLIT